MKTLILIAGLMFALTVQAQTPLQEMVQTEQAFSRMAAEKNTRDAFMAFIADDGLLFRPGAVNGKKWMLEHPVPPSDKRPLLAWQPILGMTAAAGDMGFTTGPWEAKPDINDAKPSAYGHFVTVWKKQPDGSWKFVVDLGISHTQSGGPQTLWHPSGPKSNAKVNQVVVAAARNGLLEEDRAYAQATLKDGLVKAFNSYTSPEVRLYREGSLPFPDRKTSAAALASTTGQVSWTPIAADVSRSGDLGYTHGTYEIADAAKKVTERGSYVRIWRGFGDQWRIVLDVTNAHR
jgi:ketosteroid isomerase-like protein